MNNLIFVRVTNLNQGSVPSLPTVYYDVYDKTIRFFTHRMHPGLGFSASVTGITGEITNLFKQYVIDIDRVPLDTIEDYIQTVSEKLAAAIVADELTNNTDQIQKL